MAIFPTIVWIAVSTNLSKYVLASGIRAGRISYALYTIHLPLLGIFGAATKVLLHQDAGQLRPLTGILFCVVILPVSYLATALYDEPLRKMATNIFLNNQKRK